MATIQQNNINVTVNITVELIKEVYSPMFAKAA